MMVKILINLLKKGKKENDFEVVPTQIRGFEEVDDIYRIHSEVETKLPIRADEGSAGYDFFAKETTGILPDQTFVFWTDVKAFMEVGEVLLIHIRSSLSVKYNLVLANGTGIIDSSYYNSPDNNGNIGIAIRNESDEPVVIKEGERIAQGIFMKYLTAVNDNTMHKERQGGFGSSNRKDVA